MPTKIDVQEWEEDPFFHDADPTGNYFNNVGNIELKLYNGDALSPTKQVDFVTQRACNHGKVKNREAHVRRGYTEDYGDFTAQQFNDSAGNMHLQYPAGATGIRLAVRKMPRR